MNKLPGRAANTALWLLLFGATGLGFAEDHKALNVHSDVVSISEIRPPISVSESFNEPQKRKLKEDKLRTRASVFSRLAKAARYEAQHGGVLCSRHGCATPKMKWLVRQLIFYRFRPAGSRAVKTADCIAEAESGFNPGAISRTKDWGVGQINEAAHEPDYPWWWQPRAGFKYAVLDPVYNIGIMRSMSKRGTSWTPWTGTWGQGMCRF